MAILPPGVSAESFQSAIREFQDAIGRDWVFTSDDDLYSVSRPLLVHQGPAERADPVRGRRPRHDGAGAGDRQDGEQIQDSAVRDLDGQELRLRRPVAERARQRHGRSEAHEPHSRLRRQTQLRARRARRLVHRSLSPHPAKQAQRVGRHAGSGVGQPHRQRDGPRHRLHDGLLPRPLRRAHRHGGRAAERRGHAHRHGRDARSRRAGRSTGTATARIPRGSSAKAVSASSRRWAFG